MTRSATDLLSLASNPRLRKGGTGLDLDLLDVGSLSVTRALPAPLNGVKALMLAVLDNGIAAYLSPLATVRAEAEAWIGAMSQRSPFAFPVVCEVLGLEATAVRTALRRLRDTSPTPSQRPGRRRPNVTRAGRVVVRKRR